MPVYCLSAFSLGREGQAEEGRHCLAFVMIAVFLFPERQCHNVFVISNAVVILLCPYPCATDQRKCHHPTAIFGVSPAEGSVTPYIELFITCLGDVWIESIC